MMTGVSVCVCVCMCGWVDGCGCACVCMNKYSSLPLLFHAHIPTPFLPPQEMFDQRIWKMRSSPYSPGQTTSPLGTVILCRQMWYPWKSLTRLRLPRDKLHPLTTRALPHLITLLPWISRRSARFYSRDKVAFYSYNYFVFSVDMHCLNQVDSLT